MIRICILNLLLICLITPSLKAQVPATMEQDKEKLVALQNDALFKPFQRKVRNLLKSAKGRSTNFAAVKALFETNKSLLQQLKVKHNLPAVKKQEVIEYELSIISQEMAKLKTPVKVVTYTPAYSEKEIHDYIGGRSDRTYESGSNENTGKIAITTSVQPGRTHWYDKYVSVFRQSVKVPADPTIVEARVKFYYTYFSTGWDTESGVMNTGLVINTSSNYISPAYNNFATYNGGPNMADWKKIVVVGSERFENLRDYSITKDSTFTIIGNVTPGSTIDFKLGMCFKPYSCRVGSFGAYHYTEFILSKIEVSYYVAN